MCAHPVRECVSLHMHSGAQTHAAVVARRLMASRSPSSRPRCSGMSGRRPPSRCELPSKARRAPANLGAILRYLDRSLRGPDAAPLRHAVIHARDAVLRRQQRPSAAPAHSLPVESACSASELRAASGTVSLSSAGEANALVAPPDEAATGSDAADPAADGVESSSRLYCVCPISHEIMRDPVICCDGHSYDRVNIERWLESHDTSPLTNAQLSSKALIPNHQLRAICEHELALAPGST